MSERRSFTSLTEVECISLLTRYHHGPATVVLHEGVRVPVTYELVEGTVTFTAHGPALRVNDADSIVRFEIARYDEQTDCLCQISVVGRALIFDVSPKLLPPAAACMCRWFLEVRQIVGTRSLDVTTGQHGPDDARSIPSSSLVGRRTVR